MKVSFLQVLFPLTLFLILGCSSDERSDEPGLDLKDNLPRSESERPMEGPDGDMDRDGIPNAKDPRPLYPDREFEARVSEEDGRKLEGPDGDMDGDGIPNAQDPNPLKKNQ